MKRILIITLILAGGCGQIEPGPGETPQPIPGRLAASQKLVLADSCGVENDTRFQLEVSRAEPIPSRRNFPRVHQGLGILETSHSPRRNIGQKHEPVLRPAISQDMTPKAAIRLLDKAQRDVPRKPSTNTAASAAGDALWAAICRVESDCNPQAYNQSEQAAGIAQIRPIALRDCNRIVGENCWTLADRYDVAKSRAMFDVYTGHYLRHYGLSGPEATARIWNGGGNGWQKQATVTYWVKVRVALERN